MVKRILDAALAAADPALAVGRSIAFRPPLLRIQERDYDLSRFRRIHLLSIGKAGWKLARALADVLGDFLSRGLVITKSGVDADTGLFQVIEGGHPVPDGRSLAAGQAVLDFLGEIGPDDLLICAISGGGSSLLAAPRNGVELSDLQDLTRLLLAGGATIQEINTLRRHLDILKGGGVLLHCPAPILSLILSDVVGNALEAIASGPTAPDPSTCENALQILEKYTLTDRVAPDILSVLRAGPETLKPGDSSLERVQNVLIGGNLMSIQAALRQVAQEGLHPYLLRADLTGEASEAAIELSRALRWACQRGEPVPRPFCMVAGGETTVTLRSPLPFGSQAGRGGRNTELALAAVNELVGFPNVALVSLATDGEDGSGDAAGALVTGETWQRAEELGLHPIEYLNRHDSYSFFAVLGDLVTTGPTGTNVNDLVFLFGF